MQVSPEIDAKIKPVRCGKWCDGGYRGMDACNTCDMTGSQLMIPGGKRFPNTEEGYHSAVLALTTQEASE